MGPLTSTQSIAPRRSFAAVTSAISGLGDDATTFIDRHPAKIFAVFSVVYCFIVAALSSTKLLWLDELITLHIAQLGSPTAIWHALAQGADPNPPLIHLAVLACLRIFGVHEFVLRLPAAIGYWIGLLSLFLFLRRRLSASWALAGTILSMANAAFDYSYESRSYGIFYGLAILAILCWSRAVDPVESSTRRNLALYGMMFALVMGICTNYFAVLAFVPIAGGELVRTSYSGPSTSFRHPVLPRFGLRIWLSLAVSITPLLIFLPLIRSSIAQFSPHAWNKVSMGEVFDSYTDMIDVILYPVLALFVFAVLVLLLARLCSHCRSSIRPRWLGNLANQHVYSRKFTFPRHEIAAVILLMLYPFLGYLVASIHGGMLSPRFVVPVCLGFAIAGIVVCYRMVGHLRYASVTVLGICIALFLGRVVTVGDMYVQQKRCFYQVLQSLSVESGNKPIVVADPLMILTLRHYAPPAIASRVFFPVDFPAIRFFRGEDSPEQNLWAGRDLVYHLPILTLADFQHNADDYLIVASNGNWMIRDLWAHNYPVDRLPIHFPHGAIRGFTPLDHGDPVLFLAAGDRSRRNAPHLSPAPKPFYSASNLPSAQSIKSVANFN